MSVKPYYVLMQYSNGKFLWQQSSTLGRKQKIYLNMRREGSHNFYPFKLFVVTDYSYQNAPSIGYGGKYSYAKEDPIASGVLVQLAPSTFHICWFRVSFLFYSLFLAFSCCLTIFFGLNCFLVPSVVEGCLFFRFFFTSFSSRQKVLPLLAIRFLQATGCSRIFLLLLC